MAFSLRNNSRKGSVGLDIDGGFIAAVSASGGQLRSAVSAELPAGILTEGEVVDGEALASALKDFFKRHDLPRTVRLGVSNQQIVVRQLELPRIDAPDELAAAVRFQATEAIAMPLDEAVLDHQVTGVTQDAQGMERTRVVVVAARRTMLESIVGPVRAAGLKPAGIDLDAFALVRALDRAGEPEDVVRVHCHLAGVTNLAVAVGSSCLFTRLLSPAWQNEDVDLAGSALADEIRMSIDYYGAQPGARSVDEVVLSGPGAQAQGLVEAVDTALSMPVSTAGPIEALTSSALESGEDPHRYTVAAGLALEEAA